MGLASAPLAWTGIPLGKIPEADLQRTAVALLKAVGWTVFVDRLAFRSDKGWLDLYAVHEEMRRTIYVEVKRENGSLRPEQIEWIRVHQAVGHEVFVLRPSAWDTFAAWVIPPRMLTDPFRATMTRAINDQTKRQRRTSAAVAGASP